jgi:hypothetical protein
MPSSLMAQGANLVGFFSSKQTQTNWVKSLNLGPQGAPRYRSKTLNPFSKALEKP